VIGISVSGTQIYNKPIISSKIVSLTTPSGVPSDAGHWILYTILKLWQIITMDT
jgi:hypothetical protein